MRIVVSMYAYVCVHAAGASIMEKTTIDFDSILSPFLSRLLQVTWRDAQVAEQHCSKVPTSTKSGVERESNFSIFFSARLVGREKSRGVQSLASKSLDAGLLMLTALVFWLIYDVSSRGSTTYYVASL